MDLPAVLKLRALIMDFSGDVMKEVNNLLMATDFSYKEDVKDELIKRSESIKKFCENVKQKVSDIVFETEYNYNEVLLQDNVTAQVKSIKKLCDKFIRR